MSEIEQTKIVESVTALGLVQFRLMTALATPTEESLSNLQQEVASCDAIISQLPQAVYAKIAAYWTSGVMAQINTLAAYNALPSVKLTLANSMLPTLQALLVECNNIMLAECVPAQKTGAPQDVASKQGETPVPVAPVIPSEAVVSGPKPVASDIPQASMAPQFVATQNSIAVEEAEEESLDEAAAPTATGAVTQAKANKPKYPRPKLGFWLGLIGFVLLGIGLICCQLFSEKNLSVLGGIIIALAVIIYVICIVLYFKQLRERLCPKCKQFYDFDTDIDYTVIDKIYKEHRTNAASNGKQVTETLTYKYRINCNCHNCGHQRTFNWKTNGGRAFSDGTTEYRSAYDAVALNWQNPSVITTSKAENIFGIVIGAVCVVAMIIAMSVCAANPSAFSSDLFGDIGGNSAIKMVKDGTDIPAEWQGSYYTIYQYTHISVDLTKDKCTFTESNGLTTLTHEYDAIYLPEDKVEKYFTTTQNVGYPAIVAMMGADQYLVFYAYHTFFDDKMFLVDDRNNSELYREDESLADYMNDPKDYYGTYRYDDDNKVTFYANGTADLYLNGEKSTQTYLYATVAWQNAHMGSNIDAPALVLYDADTDSLRTFRYESSAKIRLGAYPFTRTESGSSGGSSSGSGSGAGNSSGSGSGSSGSTSGIAQYAGWQYCAASFLYNGKRYDAKGYFDELVINVYSNHNYSFTIDEDFSTGTWEENEEGILLRDSSSSDTLLLYISDGDDPYIDFGEIDPMLAGTLVYLAQSQRIG